jgi:hypothetical protein
MRALVLLSLIGLSACASGKGDPVTSGRPESVPIFAGSDIRMTTSTVPHATTLAFPLERVWKALPAVYDSLSLALTVLDAKQHLIGNEGFKLRQKLGTVALSKYIDCGSAQLSPSADSYDVFLSVVTTLRPNAWGGTELATTIEAAARPMTFAQEYSRCRSTGVLEKRLADLVKLALVR